MAYPYYGNYMPPYYQPMQNMVQPMNQPLQQTQNQGAQVSNMQQNTTQPNFFCRPVASREEALGVPVDFMGSPMFFPDLAHNVVYMKRFNTTTGAADIFEFHGQQAKEQPSSTAPSFAPLDEFNATKETIGQLKETILQLQNEIDQLKKPTGRAKKNDVPDE